MDGLRAVVGKGLGEGMMMVGAGVTGFHVGRVNGLVRVGVVYMTPG